jgi:glycosyltransferase involved in cell wall biosynthesis
MRRGLSVRLAEYLEQWIYRKAHAVIAVTEGIRRTLIDVKRVPAEKVQFLPNAVDTELFRPIAPDVALKCQLGLEGHELVLYQGSIGYAHDLHTVLQAASILQETTNIHFLFVGDGSARAGLERLTSELQLRNVTFLDPVPKEELPRFFSISRCGLVALRDIPLFEGARPSKALPVMSCAKPLLYVAKGEGAKLVLEADCGVLVPPGNPEALAIATRSLIDSPELSARMGKNGRDYVRAHMTWMQVIDDWLIELRGAPPALVKTRAQTA